MRCQRAVQRSRCEQDSTLLSRSRVIAHTHTDSSTGGMWPPQGKSSAVSHPTCSVVRRAKRTRQWVTRHKTQHRAANGRAWLAYSSPRVERSKSGLISVCQGVGSSGGQRGCWPHGVGGRESVAWCGRFQNPKKKRCCALFFFHACKRSGGNQHAPRGLCELPWLPITAHCSIRVATTMGTGGSRSNHVQTRDTTHSTHLLFPAKNKEMKSARAPK
jgi:hypothetical protein